jgi:hypothetical protein
MSNWRPLLHNANGTQTDVLFDSDGKVIFRTLQETQPVLDMNKEFRSNGRRGWTDSKDMRYVASIPAGVILQWIQEGFSVFDEELDQARLARKLNDPDNFYLRTSEGRLGPVGDGTYR